jgi:hypothetical protein
LEAEDASAEESEDVDTEDLGMVFSIGVCIFVHSCNKCNLDDFLDGSEDGESGAHTGGELNTHGVPNDPIRILAEFDAKEAQVLAEQLWQKYGKSLERAVDSSGESEVESGSDSSCDNIPEAVGQSRNDNVEMDVLDQERRQRKGKMKIQESTLGQNLQSQTNQRKSQTTEKEKMYRVDTTFSEVLEMGDSLKENPFLKIAWCIPSQLEYQPKLDNSFDTSSPLPCGFEIWSQRTAISDMEMWSILVPVCFSITMFHFFTF